MKRILALVTVVFLMTASLPLSAGADAGLSFASIFGDGMVLQQGRSVQVFGFGRDGDTVTVTLKRAMKPWRPRQLPSAAAGGTRRCPPRAVHSTNTAWKPRPAAWSGRWKTWCSAKSG